MKIFKLKRFIIPLTIVTFGFYLLLNKRGTKEDFAVILCTVSAIALYLLLGLMEFLFFIHDILHIRNNKYNQEAFFKYFVTNCYKYENMSDSFMYFTYDEMKSRVNYFTLQKVTLQEKIDNYHSMILGEFYYLLPGDCRLTSISYTTQIKYINYFFPSFIKYLIQFSYSKALKKAEDSIDILDILDD